MQKRHIILILLLFLSVFKTQSQTENYPVSATLVFAAPFSLKVSDYFTSNTRMYLNLNLKDLTKPTLKVYLKWSLEGPGIRISTRDGFIPTSFIELSKGTVSLQKGSDLSLYFQRGIFDYQGLTEDVILDGSIPEGFYTMKFKALEAGSGREVSNLAESFFFVTSPQPPIINQPFNGSIVPVSNPQNVLLQWTPRQISTLESQVVYEVTIYEVAEGDDPVVVANSGILPKFNRTVSTTSTLMGASDLPLQEGKRYAMVVTAKDLNGKMNFENGGRSEVSWFQYGKGCFAHAGLDVAETAPGKVILSWTPNTTAEGYVIEYKKKDETTWIVNGSLDNSYTINELSPKTDYEFRVKTQCSGGKYSAYTATERVSVIGLITPTPETEVSLDDVLDPFSQTVSTKSDGKPFDPKNIDALLALLKPPACAVSGVSYVCGQTPSATPPVGIDLTTLAKGDVLGIYDYTVLVTEVSNGSSPFTGKGLVKLPFAGGIKVPVEFKGIKAKKGEDGTHGGCVWYVPADLNEGYFQVKGSQQDAIVKEQEKLLADIYSELIDPQSFYGTFEEALAKYEAKSKEIACKLGQLPASDCVGIPSTPAPTADDYKELVKNLHGVVKGGSDWKEKLLKHLGADASKPEMKALLDELDKIKTDLEACEKCVTASYSKGTTTGGKGGPMAWDEFVFTVSDCKIETGVGDKMIDILDKIREFLITDDENTPLALIKAIKGAKETAKKDVNLGTIIIKSVDKKWTPKKKTLPDLGDHRDYLQADGLTLPTGKKLSWIQVSANEAVWDKKAPSPHELGVNVEYEERDLKIPGKTGLMFKGAGGTNVFWIVVKDEELNILKDYLLGSAFGLEIVDVPLILTKNLKTDITLIVKDGAKILDDDRNQTAYISDTPEMPKISIEIKTTNATYNQDLAARFKITFQETNAAKDYPETGVGDERKATTIFPINASTKGTMIKNGNVWVVNYDGKYRGGDAVVEILSISQNIIVQEYKFKILGSNPDITDIHAYVEAKGYYSDYWFIKRKIRHEAGVTDGKGLQFNTNGKPRFGYPYGFGLGQIDNYDGGKHCTQQEIWNWKSNLDRGYLVLEEKRKQTLNSDFPNEIAKIKNIFDLDPDNVLPAEDQKEGDFNVIHAPSTKIKGASSVNKYFGTKKDSYPQISVIDANVIKRYNGGRYYMVKIIDASSAQWEVDRTASWKDKKGVEHFNYYVQDIGNTKE